jgi:hypothetical protein
MMEVLTDLDSSGGTAEVERFHVPEFLFLHARNKGIPTWDAIAHVLGDTNLIFQLQDHATHVDLVSLIITAKLSCFPILTDSNRKVGGGCHGAVWTEATR